MPRLRLKSAVPFLLLYVIYRYCAQESGSHKSIELRLEGELDDIDLGKYERADRLLHARKGFEDDPPENNEYFLNPRDIVIEDDDFVKDKIGNDILEQENVNDYTNYNSKEEDKFKHVLDSDALKPLDNESNALSKGKMGNPKEAVENKIENKANIFDNEFGLHDGDDLSQKNHEISLSKLDEKDDKIITNDWNKTNSANNEEEINSNRKEFNKDKLGKNFYNVAEDDASKILKELDDEKEINLNQKELNKVKSGGKNEHLKEYQEEINSDRKELNKDKSGEKNEHVKEYQEEINPDRKELKKDKPTKKIENSKDQSVAEDDILEILKKLDDEVNANKKAASDTKDTPAKKNGSVNDIDNKVEENEKIDKEENIVLNSSDTNKYLKADKESGKTNSKDVLRNRKLDTEKIKDQPQNAADNNVDTLEINEKLEDDSKNVALDTISKDQYNAENIENKVEEKETYFVEDNINDKVDNANAKKNKKMTANDNDEPQLNDFSEDSNIANKEINPDNIVEKEAPVDDMYDDEDDGKLGTKENKLKDDEKNTKDDDQDINGDEQDITDDDQKLNNDKENNTKPDDAVNQNNIDDYSQDAGEYLDNELRSKTKTKKNKNSRKRKKQVKQHAKKNKKNKQNERKQ